jgi:hypothetical protein
MIDSAGRPGEPVTLRECTPFESIQFNARSGSALQGATLVEEDGTMIPLGDVQIAAVNLEDGVVRGGVSGPGGAFSVDGLPQGRYEVWTCKEGFDEVRFQLSLDPASPVRGFQFFLGPSEQQGRRDVVEIIDDNEP